MQRGVIAAALLSGLALVWQFWPYQVDDAFITYRFAKNALAGAPLRFNPHAAPVEGFSSPLWLALTTLVGKLFGVDAIPLGSFALGVSCFLLTGYALARASSPLASAAWVALPTAVFYAATGLESCAFALCLACFSAGLSGRIPRAWLWCAAVLAPFVRPEAPWFAISGIAQQAFERGEARRAQLRTTLLALGALALSGLVLLGTRLALFGAWFPNTYFAKPRDPALATGYVATAFGWPWVWALFAAASLGAFFGPARVRGYWLAGGTWVVAAWVEGGDWMPQGRMLLPAFVLWAAAAGGLGFVEPARRRRVLSLALVLLVALGFAATLEQATRSARSLASLRREYRKLTDIMLRSGARSVAAVDIGELGFRTNLEVLDLAGLTDLRIAHAPGVHLNKVFDLGYVFAERKPDLIVIRMKNADIRPEAFVVRLPPRFAGSLVEARLLSDPRLSAQYELSLLQYPRVPRAPLYIRALYRRRSFKPRKGSQLSGPLVLLRTQP